MTDDQIGKLDEALQSIRRVEEIEVAREIPWYKSPEKFWRTIAAGVSVATAIVALLGFFLNQNFAVAELKARNDRLELTVNTNRTEAREELRLLETRLERQLSGLGEQIVGVGDKLDRLLLLNQERKP